MVDITRIADEHAELLQQVAQYDHAPADLRDTEDLLQSLEKDLKVREARMQKLIEKRKSEHKDLDKLQRSATRRLFTRIKHGGKEGLERRLEKEEREYIEAAQDEHNENQAIQELRAAVDNAKTQKAELEKRVTSRKEMMKRIDELYESAFDGPSPDFPEEDSAESELRDAEIRYEEAQARLNHEKNVFTTLDSAAAKANGAQNALQSANRNATYDTFSIGGIWTQMAEADDLCRAQALAAQAFTLVQRARSVQPLVKQVECGSITSPEWVHVVFDNLYTDFMFQKKIQQSMTTVRTFQQAIFTECAACEHRINTFKNAAKDEHDFLRSRRRQLIATRREILRRVKEDGGIRVIGAGAIGDGDSGRIGPELPTYFAQPEEGTKVLQRGGGEDGVGDVGAPAEPMQSPPGYGSNDAGPSNSITPTFPTPQLHNYTGNEATQTQSTTFPSSPPPPNSILTQSQPQHLNFSPSLTPSHTTSTSKEQGQNSSYPIYAPPPGPPPSHITPSSSQFNSHSPSLSPSPSIHLPPRPASASASTSSNSISISTPSGSTTDHQSLSVTGTNTENADNITQSMHRLGLGPRARSASPSCSSESRNSSVGMGMGHAKSSSFASNNPYRLMSGPS